MVMANPDERGEAVINADSGDAFGHVRLGGAYFADAMKALGGMADVSLNRAYEPVMLTADGLRVLIMPIASPKANEQQRADRAEAETGATAEGETEPTAVADAEVTAEAEVDAEITAEVGPTEAELEAIEAEAEQPAVEPKTEEPKRRRSRRRTAVAVA